VINLFDLVLNLYAIPLNHAGFIPLRQALHQQWEQTLGLRVEWFKASDDSETNLDPQKEIYLSYAWGGESEKLVNDLDQAFQQRGVTIVRDKRDLGYKGSIKEFMERIGRGKSVVVVISDKYLKSKNCMFELIQIAENEQFKDRIFPVVLSDANIYDAVRRLEYIKHWETMKKDLNKAMRGVSAENLQGIREEIDLFDTIRDEIANLTNILQDMNTRTPDMHRDSDFQTLYDAVMKKLEE
jgi:internalin A